MKNNEVTSLKREVTKIKEVTKTKDGWNIASEDVWSYFIPHYNDEPHVGDIMEVYGIEFGFPVRGLCINGVTIFFNGEVQLNREHAEWVEKTRKEYAVEYEKLMEKIKDDESFETVDISGMGGGYERTCQLMLRAGLKYLEQHPEFKFDYEELKNVRGLCTPESKQAEELDKVIIDSVGDCTGAQHQSVIHHLLFIQRHDYDKWLLFGKDRKYTYPIGLPKPTF